MKRKNVWKGNFYQRGGSLHDKWGNLKKERITYKQTGTGYIVDGNGKFLGKEAVNKNLYGEDIHKSKKPKGWHGESHFHSLARRGIKVKK